MAAPRNKRWILAVVLAVLFPALAVHVSCVAVVGPGTWGSGMEEKVPELQALGANPEVAEYAREFSAAVPQELQSEAGLDALEGNLAGKVFWTDTLSGEDLSVIATHQGPTWLEEQRFYLRQGSSTREIDLLAGPERQPGTERQPGIGPDPALEPAPRMIFERATLLRRGETTFVVFGRWFPWALPPLGKLQRYLSSYWDPALRPEYSLYLYRFPAGPLTYWGPGHTLKPSPDRRSAILLRSGAVGAGYYSMHLWDFEHDRLTTIASLRESDPGSDRSFDYEWSSDSRAIHITGHTGGFARRRGQPRSLDLVYLLAGQQLYDLEMPAND